MRATMVRPKRALGVWVAVSSIAMQLPTVAGAQPPDAGEAPKEAPVDPPTATRGSAQRTTGLVLGGVGLVAMGVGTFFGIVAFNNWAAAKNACPNALCPPSGAATGTLDASDARGAADISTVAFAVGGAGLVVGAVLFFSAPTLKPRATANAIEISPTVGGTTTGVSVRGRW